MMTAITRPLLDSDNLSQIGRAIKNRMIQPYLWYGADAILAVMSEVEAF